MLRTKLNFKKKSTSPNHRLIQYLNVVQGDVNNVVSEEGSRRSDVNPSSDFVMEQLSYELMRRHTSSL